MSTKNLTNNATKLVNVYNSANNSLDEIKIPKDISNREELTNYLKEYNINFLNTNMMIAETDLVLATNNSIIPDDDFTLILTPKKVKSGSIDIDTASHKEMREYIKQEVQKDKHKIMSFFGNYTQLSTIKMRELLKSYIKVNTITKSNSNKIIKNTSKSVSPIFKDIEKIISSFNKNINSLLNKYQKEKEKKTIKQKSNIDEKKTLKIESKQSNITNSNSKLEYLKKRYYNINLND